MPRTEVYQLRLSKPEKDEMGRRAREQNISIAKWLRQRMKVEMEDVIPVSEEMLERVRSGKPLRDVGRIDLRGFPDEITAADVAAAREKHREVNRYGHEAPIKLRESQVKALAREKGLDPDDKDDPIDCTAPGARFMGHELWVDPDAPH